MHIKETFFLKTSSMKDNFMKNVHSSHLHLKHKKVCPDSVNTYCFNSVYVFT